MTDDEINVPEPEKRPARTAPTYPRVSQAKGGYAPGFTCARDVEEMEDAERVAKMGFRLPEPRKG
jgi:hypothetical protein